MISHLNDPLSILIKRKIEGYSYYAYKKNGRSHLVRKLGSILCEEAETLIRRTQLDPPFDPLKIKHGRLKFGLIADANRNTHVPTKEGFRIEIKHKKTRNLDDLDFRARTTIAHEVAHSFFYDINVLPPKPIGVVSSKKSQWELESICYRIGRTLLMPSFSVSRLLTRSPDIKKASLHKIRLLMNRYKVSSDIVAWRMLKDLILWNSCFAKYTMKGEDGGAKFQRIPHPLKNSGVRELSLIKLNRIICREHLLYPYLLRATASPKRIVRDTIRINSTRFNLEFRMAPVNTIATLISVEEPHQGQRQMTLERTQEINPTYANLQF